MRSLTSLEINELESNGCTSDNWLLISVAEPFNPLHYRNVTFSGKISLGTTEGQIERCGVTFKCGIYNAVIHNCEIGDNVHINGVADFIANYRIGDNCLIRNVNCIRCDREATFGVGTRVAVLNETGGREVPIYESLSAHVAYLLAIYRHDKQLIDSLTKLIGDHKEHIRSSYGMIDDNVTIVNTGTIINVKIGTRATIDSAKKLVNGTVCSTGFAPVTIGANVIAYDFIIQSGSEVTDGATLNHVFVGQGSRLSSYFTAHDSLFFANCTCENGEAAAIFAGPYTVTMHKSSLLIAGMFSFLNAGSGSNQSNHMYKLGPIHQGIVERGSKTTSDSYVLWPARIGAFSLVMGRHASNPDTSDLPFSYLIENHGITYVVPGANLRNVGTKRDEMKWPKRDRRQGVENGCGIDLINFNILSPYTVEKMMAGNRLLKMIETDNIAVDGVYTHRGLHIRTSSLRKGREYYSLAIDKFMGNAILRRIERCDSRDDEAIRAILAPTTEAGRGPWADIAGLYAPKSEINALCHDISSGNFKNLSEINFRFLRLASDYNAMEWTWIAEHIEEWYGKPYDAFTSDDIIAIIDRWLDAELTIDKLLCDDARKEFSELSRKGFGVDDPDSAEDDFMSVRGSFEDNPFVTTLTEEMNRKRLLAADLKARFSFPRE